MQNQTGSLKASDFKVLNIVFKMSDGYVLDFSNASFSQFFADEIGIEIYHNRYSTEGNSKGKRLCNFLRTAPRQLALSALLKLWEYKSETEQLIEKHERTQPNVLSSFARIIERLGGTLPDIPTTSSQNPKSITISEDLRGRLSSQLIRVSQLAPHARGFEFEKFLKNLFDAHDLTARAAFRNLGEQIDGSFQLENETYLLEAKWTNEPIGNADLHIFEGKLCEKAHWSRGLFISYSGFTEQGLIAFGRGKRVICMDGYDVSEMLRLGLSFVDVVTKKARRAAETGNPFIQVRELY